MEGAMFKHILLPTDGSKLSGRAVKFGIEFAKSINAKITAVHVVPEFRMIMDEGFVSPMSGVMKKRFETESREHAKKLLAKVEEAAKTAGIKCEAVAGVSDLPFQYIIETAKNKKCDLILMASHGRKGLSSLLLGSETAKVLTHSKIPVLVVR
jgi:nucleotide-binding universal stress UspA family protein